MRRPIFSSREFTLLRDEWLTLFRQDFKDGPDEFSARWLEAVLRLLDKRGDTVFTRELRREEEALLAGPKRQDYIEALTNVVGGDIGNVITALPADKIKAIMIVKAYTSEDKQDGNKAPQLRLL